jgi:hypothetical protein
MKIYQLLTILFVATAVHAQHMGRYPDIPVDSEFTLAAKRIGTERYLLTPQAFHHSDSSHRLVPLGSFLRLVGVRISGNRIEKLEYTYVFNSDDTVVTHGSEADVIWSDDDGSNEHSWIQQEWYFSSKDPVKEYHLKGKILEAYQRGEIVEGLPEEAFKHIIAQSYYTEPRKTETSLGNVYEFNDLENSWLVKTTDGNVSYYSKSPLN